MLMPNLNPKENEEEREKFPYPKINLYKSQKYY